MSHRTLWCLIDQDDWEENYELDPITKVVTPRLKAGNRVEIEFLLELGQAKTFGAVARRASQNEGRTSVPFLKPLGEELPYCHFGGWVLEVHASAPQPEGSGIYGRLTSFYAVMDCGLPVILEGLAHEQDSLLGATGTWVEGVSTLWGNPGRPLSTLWGDPTKPLSDAKRPRVMLEGVRELAPVRLDDRSRVFRIAAVRLERASPTK